MSTHSVVVKQSGGISFLGLLTIVFIILKLTGVITWSWWAVTAPLWAPFSIFFGIMALLALAALLFSGVAEYQAESRRKKRLQAK